MLALSRNEGQRIVILDEQTDRRIEIMLCQIKGPVTARIGIEAPQSFRILRAELLDEQGAVINGRGA